MHAGASSASEVSSGDLLVFMLQESESHDLEYKRLFMGTLARLATRGRHADVMTHIVGHLKKVIDAVDRQELLEAIEEHRRGLVPLVVPITLIRHHLRRHEVPYLRDQVYLDPHPRELALRNHV